MGFKPQQNPSSLEIVNKFTERMRTAIDEAKSTICKAQDNMKRYYDQHRTLALVFNPGDKVFLNASDIQTTHPSHMTPEHSPVASQHNFIMQPLVTKEWNARAF